MRAACLELCSEPKLVHQKDSVVVRAHGPPARRHAGIVGMCQVKGSTHSSTHPVATLIEHAGHQQKVTYCNLL